MRKCLDCGAELQDFQMQCSECGSENLSLIEEEQVKQAENKPKGALILFVVIAIIGIICAVLVSTNANKTVPAKPIKNAVTALYSGDIQGYIDEMYGGFKADAENFFTQSYGNFDTYKDETVEILKNAYGNNYEITSQVVDVYSYTDSMVEFYQDVCTELNYNIKIEKMKHITVRCAVENDEGMQQYYIADEYSVQVGGKWYFLPKDMLVIEE